MPPSIRRAALLMTTSLLLGATLPATASADHSWNGYHWPRTENPLKLDLGDAVGSAWDAHLGTASTDWSNSSVLDTMVVPTSVTNPKSCKAKAGRVEVCSAEYGFNGWLGLAQIWVDGKHIEKGVAKLNDSYFNTSTYGTPAWRLMVMCQEVGHTFGLDHQDEDFNNGNLGTCMDYTSDPDGPPSNEHPNEHDYDQLEEIYTHLDVSSTESTPPSGKGSGGKGKGADGSDWGRRVAVSNGGHTSVHVLELGGGRRIVTFVLWA